MRLLEKAGFSARDFLRSYLRINGDLAGPLPLRPDCGRPPGAAETGLNSLKFLLRSGTCLALALAVIATMFAGVRRRSAVEPIKISRDDVALDLSGAVEIHRDQGENFQVSTAPGPDGIVRRIEVEATDASSSGDWAVFALANTQRPAARPADRGAAFPAGRLRAVLARPRLQPHRRDHPQRRLRAGQAAERRRRCVPGDAQPRLGRDLRRRAGLAEAAAGLSVGPGRLQGHGQLLHAVPRHRHRHRRPAGAVPDDPVRGQGNVDVPGDGGARLGGARLYLRRLRLPQQGRRDIAGQRADLAGGHRDRRSPRPSWCSCSPISTSTDGTAISATARWSGSPAWS